MGISGFPTAAEGVLPVLVMNTVLSVAMLKNSLRSLFQVMGTTVSTTRSTTLEDDTDENISRERRVSITQFKSLCESNIKSNSHNELYDGNSSGNETSSGNWAINECCVCLCKFEADEEVSELSCKHFFHRGCLDKWFDGNRISCPLCRSIL